MPSSNRKAQITYFMMLRQFDPSKFKTLQKEWLCKNKEHVKVYHRTNQRKNRARRQVETDRIRALRHLARHLEKKIRAL